MTPEEQEAKRKQANHARKTLIRLASVLGEATKNGELFYADDNDDEHSPALRRDFEEGRGSDLSAVVELDGVLIWVSLSVTDKDEAGL